jgi:hypothetical protein
VIANKKVILPPATDESKPSLDELLAKEEAKEPGSTATITTQPIVDGAAAAEQPVAAPHPSGTVISPSSGAPVTPPATEDDDDLNPNSIAL